MNEKCILILSNQRNRISVISKVAKFKPFSVCRNNMKMINYHDQIMNRFDPNKL